MHASTLGIDFPILGLLSNGFNIFDLVPYNQYFIISISHSLSKNLSWTSDTLHSSSSSSSMTSYACMGCVCKEDWTTAVIAVMGFTTSMT